MKVTDILPGTKVELKVLSQAAQAEQKDSMDVSTYITTVFDIIDDHSIHIHVPYEGGRLIPLPLNVRYDVVFQVKDSVFSTEGVLVDRFRRDNFYLMKFTFPSIQLTKFQRREYYRLDCNIPLIYSSLEDSIAETDTMEELYEALHNASKTMRVRGYGTILDISGGGIRFSSKSNLSECKYMMFVFSIMNGDKPIQIEVLGKLIRSTYLEDAAIYSNSVQFIYKNSKSQDKIIRYIFEEERKIRRKEMGL